MKPRAISGSAAKKRDNTFLAAKGGVSSLRQHQLIVHLIGTGGLAEQV